MAASVTLDEELTARVVRLAATRQRSPDGLLQDAVRQYVEREEARESFQQEAEESWIAYQENGRHLTGEEIRGWLQKWDSEGAVEPPECHG